MKSKIQTAISVGLLVLFIGCGPSSENDTSQKSRTPAELVKAAMNASEDFKFCIDDEAGNDSLKDCAERIQSIVAELSESASESNLAADSKEKLIKEIEKLQTALEGVSSAAESNGSDSVKSKANSGFRKQLIEISKLLK